MVSSFFSSRLNARWLSFIALWLIISLFVVGCADSGSGSGSPADTALRVERYAVPLPATPAEWGAGDLVLGGYGSDLFLSPVDSGLFYLLPDRGPNVNGFSKESKIFPYPAYRPHVCLFRLEGGELVYERMIEFRDSAGASFSGIPASAGDGVTGEVAYGPEGCTLREERMGLDPEGLFVLPDGSFWVSDEYGPYIMHFSAEGRVQRILSPFNGTLPAHLAKRRPNRGSRGADWISGWRASLCGHAEPALHSRCIDEGPGGDIPLLRIDVSGSGVVVEEFTYRLDGPRMMVSALAYISDTVLLVLERDGQSLAEWDSVVGAETPVRKLIYQVRLVEEDRSIEKRLLYDLLEVIPGYRHDKPEGIAYRAGWLYVANDDDFRMTSRADIREYSPDHLPDTLWVGKVLGGSVDESVLYRVRMPLLD